MVSPRKKLQVVKEEKASKPNEYEIALSNAQDWVSGDPGSVASCSFPGHMTSNSLLHLSILQLPVCMMGMMTLCKSVTLGKVLCKVPQEIWMDKWQVLSLLKHDSEALSAEA